jgi:hypothetical protein
MLEWNKTCTAIAHSAIKNIATRIKTLERRFTF